MSEMIGYTTLGHSSGANQKAGQGEGMPGAPAWSSCSSVFAAVANHLVGRRWRQERCVAHPGFLASREEQSSTSDPHSYSSVSLNGSAGPVGPCSLIKV